MSRARLQLGFAIAALLVLLLAVPLVTFSKSDMAEGERVAIAYSPPDPDMGREQEVIDARERWFRAEAVNAWNTTVWNNAVEANRIAAEQAAEAARARPSSSGTASSAAVVDYGSGDAAAAVRKYFGDVFDSAWGVSGCESGHDPSAISPGGGNYGLFQINYTWSDEFPAVTGLPYYNGALNADANAKFARWLYDRSGWGPWACRWAA